MRDRIRRFKLTPQQYFSSPALALGALVLIVFTGAAVRVTGSGLGCPDWPNCYEDGRLTPELGTPLLHRVRQPDADQLVGDHGDRRGVRAGLRAAGRSGATSR